MRLLKLTLFFTVLSLAVGFASSVSPKIAALGWLLGTLLSLAAGAVHGVRSASLVSAAGGGAIVGGIPILIGCGLGTVFGPVPLSGLIAAVGSESSLAWLRAWSLEPRSPPPTPTQREGKSGEHSMKYMLMVHHNELELAKLPPEEIERVVNAHAGYARELEAAGKRVNEGFRLRPGAEMIRLQQTKGRRAVLDGPHAETKEIVGGFYVLECKDREDALDWARRCPMWDCDVLELRPIWET